MPGWGYRHFSYRAVGSSVAERSASVPVAIPALKPIRRQGKKKTTAELRAQERALVDENTMLEKMVESKRKEMEALIAENVRLKSEKASLQHSRVAEAAARPLFLLPDLNEPLTEA
ncbi:hypothetical protein HPP92_021369 [Vanilla planifolia]|uniref:Uncharacterized protein n=1 Tax=Vanilla planifolia TaxID=51239 RepID=A0A835UIQ1_VANPL|nr:hypothetical protein HPP92_021369 [Vanilla planifolia]